MYAFYNVCKELFRTAREANYGWRVYHEGECPMTAYMLNGDMCIVMQCSQDEVFRVYIETLRNLASDDIVINQWLVSPGGVYEGIERRSVSEHGLASLLGQAAPCDRTAEVYAYEHEGIPVALTYFQFFDREVQPECTGFSIATPVFILEGWTGPSFVLTPSESLVDGAAYWRSRDDDHLTIRCVSAEFNQSYNPVLWIGDRMEVTGHEDWTGHSGPVTYWQVGHDKPSPRRYTGPAHDVRYVFGKGFNTRAR